VGGEAPVTPVLSLDSSSLNLSYKPCDNRSFTPGLLQSYKSDLDDEIDEGFWLRYMLSTWLRQVVDELAHT
jgi:hypothetical protein